MVLHTRTQIDKADSRDNPGRLWIAEPTEPKLLNHLTKKSTTIDHLLNSLCTDIYTLKRATASHTRLAVLTDPARTHPLRLKYDLRAKGITPDPWIARSAFFGVLSTLSISSLTSIPSTGTILAECPS